MRRTKAAGKKREPHPFRIAACCLGLLVVFLGVRISRMVDESEKVKQQVFDQGDSYYNTQARYNRLKEEVEDSNTRDFIERIARREFGFCWYGETIYRVVNVAEAEANQSESAEMVVRIEEMDMAGMDDLETEHDEVPPFEDETAGQTDIPSEI